MNQILVTERIYVTPELKRKRKFYKMEKGVYLGWSLLLVKLKRKGN